MGVCPEAGESLASQFTRAGHAVKITSRTPSRAEAVAHATGAQAVLPTDALEGNDVVVLATGYADALPALRSLGSFDRQVLVDVTNMRARLLALPSRLAAQVAPIDK